jgi:hypothetical protein
LRSNTPFPVKRKDVVNFAGAKQLDWTQVYNPMRYVKYCLGIIFILVLIIFAFVKFDCDSERIKTSEFEITPSIERTDSEYEVKKSKSIEKKIDEDNEDFLNKKKRITVDNIIPVVRITQKKKNEQVDTSKQIDTSKQVDASKQIDTSKQVDRAKQKREDKKNIVL